MHAQPEAMCQEQLPASPRCRPHLAGHTACESVCVRGEREEEAASREMPEIASATSLRRPSATSLRRPEVRRVCTRARGGWVLPAVACLLMASPGALGDQRLGFVGARLPVLRGSRAGALAGGVTTSSGGACLARMSEGDSKRLLNSRRLGAWAEGLGQDEKKLLGSRRAARGVHFLLRKGVKSEEVQEEPLLVKLQRDSAEAAPAPAAVPEAPAAAAQAVVEEGAAAAVVLGGEDRDGFKKEWGTINPVGESPPPPEGLISLTPEEEAALLAGERVQRQERDGRVGTGNVVVDVKADISTVFAVLTDLERYVERIHTVRRCTISERGAKVAKAQFALSRFNLEVSTVLRCDREANMLRFELDKERRAPMINESQGFWFLEEAPGRGGEYTRIWLSAGITCSSLLPTFLVDYAASRALPRATSWLKPTIEAIFEELPEGCGDVKGVVCGHQCEGCVAGDAQKV